MKIIRFIGQDTRTDIDFHPDSALLLPGRPLFYPDFSGPWEAGLYLAVHVNRLGKSVSEKFASRYYDSLSFALTFHPTRPDMLPEGILSGLDSSVTHGEWFSPADFNAVVCAGQDPQAPTRKAGLVINGIPVTISIPSQAEIDSAVSRISIFTTLRMGDMILMPLELVHLPLAPRTRLVINASDTEIINLKIV